MITDLTPRDFLWCCQCPSVMKNDVAKRLSEFTDTKSAGDFIRFLVHGPDVPMESAGGVCT